MTSISWLHISDFHFRSTGDEFSQDQACQALLESISRVAYQSEVDFAFVVVTGDIAFSGQPAEYIKARVFLDKLVRIIDINPSCFYFVPGNHDVDRSLQELAYHGGRTQINSPARVDDYLADVIRIAPLLERQSAFWSFVNDFTDGQQRTNTEDGLGYVAKLDIDQPTICLLGLNSAWLSGIDDEKSNLVIGERHIINAIDTMCELNPHFVIALAHHSVTCLTEWDATSCHTHLLPAVDLYLRGHLHTPRVSLSSSPEAPCVEIAAGASHASRFHDNSYNIITIDPAMGDCKVQCYQYRHAIARFDLRNTETVNVSFQGSIHGTRSEFADTIRRNVPEAAQFDDFMAGLLVGELNEIPLLVEGRVTFAASTMAPEFMDDESLVSVRQFSGLQNLLRLYDPTVSLDARITDNAEIIRQYADDLSKMISEDPSCAPRLQSSQRSRITGTEYNDVPNSSWSLDLIDELSQSEHWDELESLSKRLVTSPNPTVRRKAKVALATALMHSDQLQKRKEAFAIASELVSDGNPSDHEFVLAAATAEIVCNNAEALRITLSALEERRTSPELIEYAQGLSLRIGNRDLRRLIERSLSVSTEKGVQ